MKRSLRNPRFVGRAGLFSWVALGVLLGCQNGVETTRHLEAVDTLYTNGVIWTGAGLEDADSLGVRGGVISFVGRSGSVLPPAKTTIDLAGQFVTPGLADNHVHFLEGGAALSSVDLRDANSREAFVQRIVNYAQTLPQGRWVLQGNWDHELWGGELPHKKWIDKETPDTPVFVLRLDGHMALANSAALRAAGLTRDSKAPLGGALVRDAAGELTGIVKGNALNLILSAIPKPSDEQTLEVLASAQSLALSLGLTQIHAVTANETETEMLRAFRLADQQGLLKLRVFVSTPIEHWADLQALVVQEGTGSGRLRWGGVKGFVDGSLGATTAWFHAPYTDAPEHSGSPLQSPSVLRQMMRNASAAGLRLSIHAIGDRAIDTVVDSFRDIGGEQVAGKRFRIEHFQHPSTGGIQAVSDSGIIASMQPYHAIDDGRWAEERIGSDRIQSTYAFRSILDAGVRMTFGSDWPVAPLSPMAGIYAAVARRTTDGKHPDGWLPKEKISVVEALAAYTSENAYANFEEDVAGTLELGKRADLVVWTKDIRSLEHAEIPEVSALRTVIAGETVYQRAR